jgi:hypothetical protein
MKLGAPQFVFVTISLSGDDDGHAARLGEVRIAYHILVGRSEKEGKHQYIDAGIILKRILMK